MSTVKDFVLNLHSGFLNFTFKETGEWVYANAVIQKVHSAFWRDAMKHYIKKQHITLIMSMGSCQNVIVTVLLFLETKGHCL